MKNVTSIVFDLGNVLIDWNPRYLYRKLLKNEVEDMRDEVVDDLNASALKINEAQIEYTKLIDKINTVNNLCDGFINDGKHTSYKLSGTTNVFSTSSEATTDCELGYDYKLCLEIIKKVKVSEYKRYQAPPGIRVSKKAFGTGRRYPIINKYDVWDD